HTKVTNLLSLMPPIHVGGTLANPDFSPDVGAAAVGLVGNVIDDILRQPGNLISSLFGSDESSAEQKICNAAYAKAERTAFTAPAGKAAVPSAPPAAQPAPAPKKPPSDPIQDLGQGIQRNLRGLFGK